MAKYRNLARDAQLDAELEAEEAEYRKQFAPRDVGEEETEQVGTVASPVVDSEEETWKKRHADLRSYTQRQLNQKDTELSELKARLTELEKNKNRLPENMAEAQEWVKEYPDLARVIGTLIDERAEKHVSSVADEVKDVRAQLEAERLSIARERAMSLILKKHPDFLELVNDDTFKEWVESQPTVRGPRIGQALYDALYNNETDADAAIQAVNIFKQDTSVKPKKEARNDAALSIRRPATSTPNASNSKRTFSESEIDKMKPWDFDKYEDEIEEARREGRIVYDISGAAR